MTDKQETKKRDRMLLISPLLFINFMIAELIQAWILKLYIDAAVSGH